MTYQPYESFEQVQAKRQARSDAIATALAGVDKGQHGRRHHRYISTVEMVYDLATITGWRPVHSVEWCFDCGTERSNAELRPTPSSLYDDHPAVGFCGYLAKQPGSIWPIT